MADNEIKLEPKLVGSIKGIFLVPGYQRGYRWGEDEVTRLLEDIYTNGTNPYCLQPIVVKNNNGTFELIDGQQRLTTLFILLSYLKKEFKPKIDVNFKLTYETREKSEEFLTNINEELANSNIDFFHIFNTYKTIDNWFNKQENNVVVADDIYGYLVKNVKVIWYEVNSNEDSIALFTRLNIGKIPLTSAELVKAMFLCNEGGEPLDRREKQEEISLQWDNIEKELHNESLWYFLTNKKGDNYQTRIDLLLNLISERPKNCKETYYTFFKFDEKKKTQPLTDIWQQIQHTFLILKDWFEDHELYHKVGYLIASDSKSLQSIYNFSKEKKKTEFREKLNSFIKESIKIDGNYGELEYKKDYDQISKLLLLFNVESVRQIDEHAQRFPFDKYKDNSCWSLEHIHAQQSDGLKTIEQWREWLQLHVESLKSVKDLPDLKNELIKKIEETLQKKAIEKGEFSALQEKVISLLSVKGNAEYLHSISNLALLNQSDNAALNNSTFDVKRNKIVEMDKKGSFIPFATKMVFLKYYTPSAENQLNFWGIADRKAYIDAINAVLKDYLSEKIEIEEEEK